VDTWAVVLERPERLALRQLDLPDPVDQDVVVRVEWSGISTGTERLLWEGRMPDFPGMGYPLVPGYESVGRVEFAGPQSGRVEGERVFVPGARCFGSVRGLFGGAASRVVVPGSRVHPVDDALDERAVLLALAATARHALEVAGRAPELIVGHGVLGRLLARLAVGIYGAAPVVWETDPQRATGALGYGVVDPRDDARRDYRCAIDASGDSRILDALMTRLAKGGQIVLAGFYAEPLAFQFAPAFMREAAIRVAAEWQPADLQAVRDAVTRGALSLDGLVTHRRLPSAAAEAYRDAFADRSCLKMVLDWRSPA